MQLGCAVDSCRWVGLDGCVKKPCNCSWLQLGSAVDLRRCARERLDKMVVSKSHVIVVVNVRCSLLGGCPQLFAARPPHPESVLGWHALRDALFACCAHLCHCSCLPFVARSAFGLAAVVPHNCCAPATRLSSTDQVRFRWRRRVCIVLDRCFIELRSAWLACSAS